MGREKIKSFTDLKAWQKAHKLVLETYKLCQSFPKEELYGLASQMKRAAVSISSNIAEGFSRQTKKEKTQMYYIALGSLTELQNQLVIARDLKFISDTAFDSIAKLTIEVSKLVNSLIKNAI